MNETCNKQSIELIFRTFSRRYGHLFKMQYDSTQARQVWHKDLNYSRITDEQVIQILNETGEVDKPLSPGGFIKLAKAKLPMSASHKMWTEFPRLGNGEVSKKIGKDEAEKSRKILKGEL